MTIGALDIVVDPPLFSKLHERVRNFAAWERWRGNIGQTIGTTISGFWRVLQAFHTCLLSVRALSDNEIQVEREAANRTNVSQAKPVFPMHYAAIRRISYVYTEVDEEGRPVHGVENYLLAQGLWCEFLAAGRPGSFWPNCDSDPPLWYDSIVKTVGGIRGLRLSGADGGAKSAKRHNASNKYIIIPIDPCFFYSWRKLTRMSYSGRLPEREEIRATDMFCRAEFFKQKGVAILLNRFGEAYTQQDATRFLRRALMEVGGLSAKEAGCFCLRSLRVGYLSYLYAKNFALEKISKLAAHADTKTTTTYVKDAAGNRALRKDRKKRPDASLSDYLKTLPVLKVAKSSSEAFGFMRRVAQDYILNGKKPDIVRRTDNASRFIAVNPFGQPQCWGTKWSFYNSKDRERHGVGDKAQTWGSNREKTRG